MEKFKTADENGNEVELTQDEIGNTIILNSSIRTNELLKGLEIALSVYNVFDTQYYHQDGSNAYQPTQPGRQIIFTLSYHFNKM